MSTTPIIPPIGTRVRVIGGGSDSPDGDGTVIGAGHELVDAYRIPGYSTPAHLQSVALVRLDHGVWSKEQHFHVSVITVHPDNLDLEV